ncbi:hypothetical protein [Streptomyces europaeiscabiei]|uniref:hypothetical protein n=1 Tax=Streptomyces europaeiscabiei TaxID=146819 RepID=UPI0029B4F753|nr:hypothetical protein [Streptomyces europaeiscabiei]MDX3867298.1 hypothetical protein [Streptomyces europaeiscabiei]
MSDTTSQNSNDTVTVEITKYSVVDAAIPADHEDRRHFTLQVQRRGDGTWAIHHKGTYLGEDGRWGEDAHGFDHDTALARAKEEAPHLVVNGLTIGDVLARRK